MKKLCFIAKILFLIVFFLPAGAFAFKTQVIFIKNYSDFSKGSFNSVRADKSFGGSLILEKNSSAFTSYGKYISGPLKPDFPFNEAVLSWNVQTKESTYLDFYLKVNIGGKWSEWFKISRWKTDEQEKKNGKINANKEQDKFEPVKLEIDTLQLSEKAEEVQVMVDFFSKDPENSPVVKMISLCLSDNSASAPEYKKNQRIQNSKILKVPFFSQAKGGRDISSLVCGPTSLTMILAYYGINKNVRDVAFACYDKANDAFGNWSFNIAAISEFGFYGWVSRFYSLDQIREEIEKGYPVIAGISYGSGELTGSPCLYSNGHLLVIRGFDLNGDVVVNDPGFLYEADGAKTYNKNEFEKVWLRSGGYVLLFRPEKF